MAVILKSNQYTNSAWVFFGEGRRGRQIISVMYVGCNKYVIKIAIQWNTAFNIPQTFIILNLQCTRIM